MRANDASGWGPEFIQPEQEPVLVGRGSTVQVSLAHPAVSRHHAELRRIDGKLVVRDVGSRFGTRINGKRVSEQVLQEGDCVEFGPVGYELRGGRLHLAMPGEGIRLEAFELAINRGGCCLLRGVNLSFQPGQFIGLLGPSGSGKTTLLKCLAGYLLPSAGHLSFDGKGLEANLESYRMRVGYVPQDDVTYPALTGRENLDFALRLRSAEHQAADRAEVINVTLERLRLTAHADKRAVILSGGERKRINVGMELLTSPDALYLDEPTAGLDPAGETRLMRRLKELAGRGVTVVCATQVMDNLVLFDQVVVIANQTTVYCGPPQQLLAHFQVPNYAELYETLENFSHRLPQRTMPPSAVVAPVVATSKVLEGIQGVPITKSLRFFRVPSRKKWPLRGR